jgi:hypothetical protein
LLGAFALHVKEMWLWGTDAFESFDVSINGGFITNFSVGARNAALAYIPSPFYPSLFVGLCSILRLILEMCPLF